MERNTRQRGAIKRVLQRATRPLNPTEVLAEARREVNGLGIATVYRNLGKLLEERWLVTVEVPSEAARFELSSLPHHHHFRCRHCKQVYVVPCPLTSLEGCTPEGFVAEGHDMIIHGRCNVCLD
jgi:Fur family ferric uptake transcriptional regulator